MLPTLTVACLLFAAPSRPAVFDGTVTASAKATVLTIADGTVYMFEASDAAKLLTKSTDLHGRPVRVTASVSADGRRLRVTKVQTLKAGKPFDVDYWCENCQMNYDEPGICKCCGGETVLRERPAP